MFKMLRLLAPLFILVSLYVHAEEDMRDARSLEAFVDGVVKTTMDDAHIAALQLQAPEVLMVLQSGAHGAAKLAVEDAGYHASFTPG